MSFLYISLFFISALVFGFIVVVVITNFTYNYERICSTSYLLFYVHIHLNWSNIPFAIDVENRNWCTDKRRAANACNTLWPRDITKPSRNANTFISFGWLRGAVFRASDLWSTGC